MSEALIEAAVEPSVEVQAISAEPEVSAGVEQPALATAEPAKATGQTVAIAPSHPLTSIAASKAVDPSEVVAAEQPETESVTRIPAKPESIIGVPKLVKVAGSANGFLISQWLDVPTDVTERVKTLPVPAMPKPKIRPFSLVETTQPRILTTISARELKPLIPHALTAIPAESAIALTQNTVAGNFQTIAARRPLPLLSQPVVKPVTRTFALTETVASRVNSTLSGRKLMPLLPNITGRSFGLVESVASNISTAPIARSLMPLARETVNAKPTVRFGSLGEMTATTVSLPIVSRPAIPYFSMPEVFKLRPLTAPLTESTALHISSKVATRPLSPLVESVAVKPVIRTIAPAEMTATKISSGVSSRELLPLLAQVQRSEEHTSELQSPC